MKTFTDVAGRTWTLALTLGSAMKVKAKLDIDLLQPEAGDPPLLTRLGTDELLLGEVLCALLEGQFEARRVTGDDVRAAFDGRTLLAAQEAFYLELEDFFRMRGRGDRALAVAKQKALIAAAIKAAETRIGALDIAAAVQGAGIPGATSGALPEASGSIPGP